MDENKRRRYSIAGFRPSLDRFSLYSYRPCIRDIQAEFESKKRYELEMDSGGRFSLSDHNDIDYCSGGLDAV